MMNKNGCPIKVALVKLYHCILIQSVTSANFTAQLVVLSKSFFSIMDTVQYFYGVSYQVTLLLTEISV